MGLHEQHRKRMDDRVKQQGIEGLNMHEQLEYLLYAVIPRGDTNKIAHELLDKFLTIRGVFEADPKELKKIKGIGHRTAMFLSNLPQILGIVEKNIEENKKKILDTDKEIENFVKGYFYNKLNEAFYVLSLNSRKYLNAVTKIADGIEGETPVYMEKVLKELVITDAKAAIFVHNHPCGNENPSLSDIAVSRELKEKLEMLNIEFVDSIITAGRKCRFLKKEGFLGETKRRQKMGV